MNDRKTVIVFALFPGVTQLDFTGPYQVFSALPGASVILASREGGTITSTDGITFAGLRRLADIPACDLVCVPGGMGVTDNAISDDVFLAELRRLAGTARYITSVCTGSLALGAAGLLRGKRAACHWAWRDLLVPFGATPAAGRVVRDGNVITGGGVTAGIDFALTLVAELAGEETAQAIQLQIEYAPAPPFDAGTPESAPGDGVAAARARGADMRTQRDAIVARVTGVATPPPS